MTIEYSEIKNKTDDEYICRYIPVSVQASRNKKKKNPKSNNLIMYLPITVVEICYDFFNQLKYDRVMDLNRISSIYIYTHTTICTICSTYVDIYKRIYIEGNLTAFRRTVRNNSLAYTYRNDFRCIKPSYLYNNIIIKYTV